MKKSVSRTDLPTTDPHDKELSSVEFDDLGDLEEGWEVLGLGQRNDLARHVRHVCLDVGRNGGSLIGALAGDAPATVAAAHPNNITEFYLVAGNIHHVAINRDVAVADHLASMEDALGVAQAVNDGGEPKL